MILQKIRTISRSHIVHPGLEIFKNPPTPSVISVPPTSLLPTSEITQPPPPSAPPPPPPFPPSSDDLFSSPPPLPTPDNKQVETVKKEGEESGEESWVVQPGDVPGLKESGWTREMDEM